MRLVSIEAATAHCRRDTVGTDDHDFALKVEGASEMVMGYISERAKAGWTDSAGEPFEDTAGDALDVPKRIRSATLTLVEHLYRNRDGKTDDKVPEQYGYGYLPQGVVMLLYPMRKPTVV